VMIHWTADVGSKRDQSWTPKKRSNDCFTQP